MNKKTSQLEWCWRRVKQAGMKPSDRISFSMIPIQDESSVLFGGVYDQDDDANADEDDDDEDEVSNSNFFNDLYKLDLVNHKWSQLTLRGKKESKPKQKTKADGASATSAIVDMISDASSDEDENKKEDEGDKITVDDVKLETNTNKAASEEDDPFTLSFASGSKSNENDVVVTIQQPPRKDLFVPHQRRSSYLVFHKGYLYLYGGKFEDKNEREFTFNDMYCLNLKKLDEWRVIYEDREIAAEIKKANEATAKEDLDDEDDDDDESDDDDDDEDMEIDAPAIEPNESVEKYYERTEEVWMSQAEAEFPDEKSKKLIKRMAYELCTLFWTRFNSNDKK